MYIFFKNLTKEQRLASMGVAIDLAGCEQPTRIQFAMLDEHLSEFAEALDISKEEASTFLTKMQEMGRLIYATNVLKGVDKKILSILYKDFYRVVKILQSEEGKKRLNSVYKSEFKFSEDDIHFLEEMESLNNDISFPPFDF